jgi:hypothetical protein
VEEKLLGAFQGSDRPSGHQSLVVRDARRGRVVTGSFSRERAPLHTYTRGLKVSMYKRVWELFKVMSASLCLYKRVLTIQIQEGLGASAVMSASPCLYKRVLTICLTQRGETLSSVLTSAGEITSIKRFPN